MKFDELNHMPAILAGFNLLMLLHSSFTSRQKRYVNVILSHKQFQTGALTLNEFHIHTDYLHLSEGTTNRD